MLGLGRLGNGILLLEEISLLSIVITMSIAQVPGDVVSHDGFTLASRIT